MIARRWETGIDVERAEEYERFAREVSLPMFRRHTGFRGALMSRDGARCTVITLWASQGDVVRVEQSAAYRDTVDALVATGLLHGEQSVRTEDVHLWIPAPT